MTHHFFNACVLSHIIPRHQRNPRAGGHCWRVKRVLCVSPVCAQNATVSVKYSWGVFRALSQMIALSYGSMDAPTSTTFIPTHTHHLHIYMAS